MEDITEKLILEKELLQSQKLASLGQLAAGVTHEINNPTGFVSSNLKTLADYQHDLIRLIKDFQHLKEILKNNPENQHRHPIGELLNTIEVTESDIEFIQEDIKKQMVC